MLFCYCTLYAGRRDNRNGYVPRSLLYVFLPVHSRWVCITAPTTRVPSKTLNLSFAITGKSYGDELLLREQQQQYSNAFHGSGKAITHPHQLGVVVHRWIFRRPYTNPLDIIYVVNGQIVFAECSLKSGCF